MRWIVLTGLIVMALAGALMLYRQGEKAVANQDWRRVQGTVTESQVDQRAARSNERQWDYKAIIHYRYEVDGRPYAGTQRRFPEPGYSTTEAPETEIAARYPAGSPVWVYVNPANPAESVLETGRHWTVWAGIGLALAVALIAGYFLLHG